MLRDIAENNQGLICTESENANIKAIITETVNNNKKKTEQAKFKRNTGKVIEKDGSGKITFMSGHLEGYANVKGCVCPRDTVQSPCKQLAPR